jgi:hypothetical protein
MCGGGVEMGVKRTVVEPISVKVDMEERKVYCNCVSAEETVELEDESRGYVRSCAERKMLHARKTLEWYPPAERLVRMAGKGGVRAKVCGILIKTGTIQADEYKKFNRGGDIRFLAPFVVEKYVKSKEGCKLVYVLTPEIKKELKKLGVG